MMYQQVMHDYARLINPVMDYPWGSRRVIADLLGDPVPSPKPQAELWMGAHPKAPSEVEMPGGRRRLDEILRAAPGEILGSRAAEFGGQLPFLFKVLAAEKPLSIQAHPDRIQARAGFERENRLGIPIDAPQRNYRDPNHKPECLCALSEFWALCGFRRPAQIAEQLAVLCPSGLSDEIARLPKGDERQSLREFFGRLMAMGEAGRGALISEVLERAAQRRDAGDPVADWVQRLAEDYPGDIGILMPAVLNLLCLAPGEAIFLPAGCLHAYLGGSGVELMANSDNVLRGGLTPKHVDVAELMRVLNFEPYAPARLRPEPVAAARWRYPCPAREFELARITIAPGLSYRSPARRGVEILLCTEGRGRIMARERPQAALELVRGQSILVPAAAPAYELSGKATFYAAGLPEAPSPAGTGDEKGSGEGR